MWGDDGVKALGAGGDLPEVKQRRQSLLNTHKGVASVTAQERPQ